MHDIVLFQGTTSMPIIGRNRDTIRKLINKPYLQFDHDIENKDNYEGFHIAYNKENICVALEIFNDEEIYYNNHQLIGLTRKDAALLIKNLHSECIPLVWDKDDTYLTYLDIDLAIGLNCETRRVGYVLIGRKGYFKDFVSNYKPIDINSITN